MRWSFCLLAAGVLAAPDVRAADSPPRLKSAGLAAAPWNATTGGIAAFDVTIDEKGSVARADRVQDVAPHGDLLQDALASWLFEPAISEGRPVPARVLVLGFFRPPALNFAAPETPRYKGSAAPDEIPWPTSVTVPPWPVHVVTGGRKVLMAVDISDRGAVQDARVVGPSSPFDEIALGAMRQWKFRPVTRGNRTVASRAFIVFSFTAPV